MRIVIEVDPPRRAAFVGSTRRRIPEGSIMVRVVDTAGPESWVVHAHARGLVVGVEALSP